MIGIYKMAENTRGKPLKVLIADDDEGDRYILKLAFQEIIASFELEFAFDGQKVLDCLNEKLIHRTEFPDVIFLDLNMPIKDGREALSEIRANPTFRNIYIVIYSTSNSPEDRQSTLDMGADCYYTKPSDLNDLIEILKIIHREATKVPGANL